jgi:hypothetical protein
VRAPGGQSHPCPIRIVCDIRLYPRLGLYPEELVQVASDPGTAAGMSRAATDLSSSSRNKRRSGFRNWPVPKGGGPRPPSHWVWNDLGTGLGRQNDSLPPSNERKKSRNQEKLRT